MLSDKTKKRLQYLLIRPQDRGGQYTWIITEILQALINDSEPVAEPKNGLTKDMKLDILEDENDSLRDALEEEKKRTTALRVALQFYACKDNFVNRNFSKLIMEDKGEVARRVLEETTPPEKFSSSIKFTMDSE